MKYSKGTKGPMSRTTFTIVDVVHKTGNGCGMARGHAIARLKGGPRGVSFMVQGRHYEEIRDRLVPEGEVISNVRWTGREAVTFMTPGAIQP